MKRILVCGGREYSDAETVNRVLDEVSEGKQAVIIEGGATGADYLAAKWAQSRRMRLEVFAADWAEYGKAAGPIRNQKMLDMGKPDVVVAFPGGRGTADMVRRACQAGVPVITGK
jgi:predicted polyphosphate/ATP-dependent NAD kinase